MLFVTLITLAVLLILFRSTGSDSKFESAIRSHVRQAARWAVAAEQDQSPLIAVVHANYAAGYTWALKDIATPKEIKTVSGVDFQVLERNVVRIQDETTRKMVQACPQYAGNANRILSKIAGEA